jgi:hypothetical protein
MVMSALVVSRDVVVDLFSRKISVTIQVRAVVNKVCHHSRVPVRSSRATLRTLLFM